MDFDYFIISIVNEWSSVPTIQRILLTARLAVLFLGLVGNVLVIAVVVKIPQMKTATNYFVLNLAVADLLVYIFWVLPSLIGTINRIYGGTKLYSLMCKAGSYLQAVAVCASAYSLAAISGVRLMATWFPLRRKVTKSVVRRINLFIWICAAGLNLPFIILLHLTKLNEAAFTCIWSWPPGLEWDIEFTLVHLGLFYLLPLSFISFCYFGIWLRVRRRNVPTDASASQMELVHQRTKASVTKLAIILVTVFAVSWLPLYVTVLWLYVPVLSPLGPHAPKGETGYIYLLIYARPIGEMLGFANSFMNPILYAFFNQNFRFALKRLIWGPPTYTRPMSFPSPHLLNNRNQAAGCRTNSDRFNIELQPSHRRSSQLKSTRHNASDRRVSDVVMLHQTSSQLPAFSRSLTF